MKVKYHVDILNLRSKVFVGQNRPLRLPKCVRVALQGTALSRSPRLCGFSLLPWPIENGFWSTFSVERTLFD